MSRFMIAMIKIYQFLFSPFFGQSCRFAPSCSEYAITVFEKHGTLKGAGLAIWRILRCNPWSDGGQDPAP